MLKCKKSCLHHVCSSQAFIKTFSQYYIGQEIIYQNFLAPQYLHRHRPQRSRIDQALKHSRTHWNKQAPQTTCSQPVTSKRRSYRMLRNQRSGSISFQLKNKSYYMMMWNETGGNTHICIILDECFNWMLAGSCLLTLRCMPLRRVWMLQLWVLLLECCGCTLLCEMMVMKSVVMCLSSAFVVYFIE